MMFLAPMFYSLVVSVIVVFIAYLVAKQSARTRQHGNFSQPVTVRERAVKEPEQKDWHQQAMKQHQIESDEESPQHTEEKGAETAEL